MDARHLVPLLAALFLSFTARAANHDVTLFGSSFSPKNVTVAAGDTVTFRNPSGGLHNAVSDPGSPNMFRCANGCDGAGGNGNPSAAEWTAVVTLTNTGVTNYFCEIHGGAGGVGMSGTITVVSAPSVVPAPVNDLVRLHVGDGPVDIDVLANDLELDFSGGGSLTIVQAPTQGVAVVVDGGVAATPADDRVRYTVPGGVAVDTVLRYRICNGAQCGDAEVRVLARGLRDDDLMLDSAGDAGFADIAIGGLPSLPSARYETTALVRPGATGFSVDPDLASPENPWDGASNVKWREDAIVSNGAPVDYVLVADAWNATGELTLYIGRDLDGDFAPDADEVLCTSAMAVAAERCEARITHPGTGAIQWWAAIHNPTPGESPAVTVAMAAIPAVPVAGGISMTGPGHLDAGQSETVRVGWQHPGLEEGEFTYALAKIRPTPSTDLGWTPVQIWRGAGEFAGVALVSGRPIVIDLAPGTVHDRIYIDVPPNATSLNVTVTGGDDWDVYLSRRDSLSMPGIDPAPTIDQAAASATGIGDESLTIVPPLLEPGRWYVTPSTKGAFASSTVLRATVEAAAPEVRSGSYFNPDRSGHGLFLYPAGGGSVWTVLWYHYFEDASPTWYYLEGGAPAANGVFNSAVYRSAWDGDSNFLTPVGEATLTPTGPDSFRWSYTVDGQSGSEVLYALGRGCPMVDGVQRDTSATWFDPATAGTGYSVQVFPNGYEYNAAFVYDGHGRPRYLAAELPPPPEGAVSTYALEQLAGFCPLCERTGAPTRTDIGTFTRTLDAGGTLERIEVDAIYAGGIPGAWTGDDTLQSLGGPGATQGCDE